MPRRRSDSVLWTLPDAKQAEIYALRVLSLDELKESLAAEGIKTSRTALSNFLSQYQFEDNFRDAYASKARIIELLTEGGDITANPAAVSAAAEFVFTDRLAREGNVKGYATIEKVKRDREKVELAKAQQALNKERAELARQIHEFNVERFRTDLAEIVRDKVKELQTAVASTEDSVKQLELVLAIMFPPAVKEGQP